jgi:prepilin-type N-terminal cleavage/methylation domain-containing protein
MARAAFTLVEMLVVIAIISILMTAGSIGLSGMGGKGVTSGVATAESLFDEARTTAGGKNLRSCVLVAKTLDNNSADDLRRILVAYEEIDISGTAATNPNYGKAKNPGSATPNWMLSSRGAVLPDQTFFSQKYSQKDIGTGGTIDQISSSIIKDSSGADLKSTSPFKGNYFIYQFNSQGICTTPGASFVIGSGARSGSKPASGSNLPRTIASAKRDFGGFVIWRNGRTSVFRSPEQMKNLPDSITDF